MPLALRLCQVPQLPRLGHCASIDAPAAVSEVEDAFFSIDSIGAKRMSTLVSVMVILENSRNTILVEQRAPVLDDLLRQRILGRIVGALGRLGRAVGGLVIARENEGHLPGALGQGLSKPGRLLPFDSFGEIGIQNDQAQVVADVHRVKTALGRQWKQAVKIFRILRLFAGATGDLVIANRHDHRDQATVGSAHAVEHPRLQPVVPLGHLLGTGGGVSQVAAQQRKPRVELRRTLVHRVEVFSAVHHVAAGHESEIGRERARQGAKLEVPPAASRPLRADGENVLRVGLQPPQLNVV